jgi:hypothetical protein
MAKVIRMPEQRLEYAECRSLGHEWRKHAPVGVDDQHSSIRRPFALSTGCIGIPSTCTVCGTEKVRWITRSGESVTRYEHPEGYSRHGDDVLSAQEWRHNYVETLFSQFEAAINATPRRKRGSA